jgi:hypothetical protein
MGSLRSLRDHGLVVLALLGVLLPLRHAAAQETPPPTLDDILVRLEVNLVHYDKVVPSFFCDEHIVSQVRSAQGTRSMVTDSIFRLKRIPSAGKSFLTETRETKTIDGHPAKGDEPIGLAMVRGAFSGGLALVSLNQKTCMRYTLKPIQPGTDGPYIVEFETVPKKQRSANCLLQEDGSGRVLIDSDTIQVERIELTVPKHVIVPHSFDQPTIEGVWTVSVDYVPVALGNESLWMPSTIESRMTGGSVVTAWSYEAGYRNFHKLDVTSRIVPSSAADAP